jgi:adenosine kinase
MDILLAGSIAYDYLMRFPGRFRDTLIEQSLDKISVSFLADEMTRHYGGVSANIAYTLGLLGGRPRLFGTVGRDFGEYRQHLEAVGVDTSGVILLEDVFTGSFFVNTDLDNNQIATFYAGAMGEAGRFSITDHAGSKPDLVVISPNDPSAMLNQARECAQAGIPFMFDPSQQVARLDGDGLRLGIDHCTYLACNEYEWEVIQQRTGYTIDALQAKNIVFIHTLGADGTNIYHEGAVDHIPALPPAKLCDPTGAGDAFRAGLLRGISLGLPWAIAGRIGALSATYALEHKGPQNHRFSLSEFVARYRTSHDDAGALDSLLA